MGVQILDIHQYFSHREGEEKIGEKIQWVSSSDKWKEDLKNSDAQFVILGIPEDIGVRANFGRAGAYSAFGAAMKSFLSMQNNRYLNAENILLLGVVDVDDLMRQAEKLNPKNKEELKELRHLVSVLDSRVEEVVLNVFESGKIPIVIGGGHNNTYPIIKSAYKIFQEKINIVNCDAHSDLRIMEGRHSGNGFRYAMEDGYIYYYYILGLHEQYIAQNILEYIATKPVSFYTYEDIFIREKISWNEAMKNAVNFLSDNGLSCGLELDLDAITNVPSSARTSSGISPIDARKYIYFCSNQLNCVYLHLAEGAPETAHLRADYKTGKLLAYLICDFIKGINEKHYATT